MARPMTYAVLLAMLLAAPTAFAGELDQLQNLGQAQFRLISEDLGAALSSKSYVPSAPLGVTGFDVGLNITATSLKHHDLIEQASSDSVPSSLPFAQIRVMKGLPWDIDIGASYSYLAGTDIKYWGVEARYAIVAGSTVMPAVSVRGSYTKLTGIEQLGLDTKGLDVSISKKILLVTPYAGAGYVWVSSKPNGVPGLEGENFSYPKLFAGLRANLLLASFTFEVDKTGDALSYGLRVGVGF
jgi:hypothetical protein